MQDSEGNTFTVDSEGSVSSGGGGSSPSGDSDAQAASIKQALIQEGVAYFREEITFWLDNHEKGPLEEAVVLRCIKRAKECQAFR